MHLQIAAAAALLAAALPMLLPALARGLTVQQQPPEQHHVVYASDGGHAEALVASIRSLLSRSASPERMTVHVLDTSRDGKLRRCLLCNNMSASPSNRAARGALVHLMPAHGLEWYELIRVKSMRAKRLRSEANYARFAIPDLLPADVKQAFYLDCDTIVRDDLVAFIDTVVWAPGKVLAAVTSSRLYDQFNRFVLAHIFEARFGQKLDPSKPVFNAGVVLYNLEAWRAQNFSSLVRFWLMQHKYNVSGGLWPLGSQPPLQLAAYGRWQPLPDRWNVDELGNELVVDEDRIRSAAILHWSGGPHKPWLADGHYKDEWTPFVSPPEIRERCSSYCSPADDALPR